ncbi:DUF4259 domain-containing protein [Asticcacaulis benevestitus]|uniref:DUF4259 domain-containing protein n=1 Tax=Asticcacaulis benevestitus DSM 16100 = ATCC BAA-896 TaxID=1121022 RepID=V4Q3I1_9CAUL|nr:DUF4259 domain-containing protein [Asticcacaulis benevestitus]ESQ92415.1 hypothetical protein ABENE_08545 [Asticcacaulis benevestitus DSM 16100 = ATCC BAA-896]
MGTWGKEPFADDDALDFVDALEEDPTWVSVRLELEQAANSKGYLEAPDGSQAVASAALVASCLGRRNFLPDNYKDLTSKLGPLPADMVKLAIVALGRVRGPESELAELWQEANDGYAGWLQTLDDIQAVLEEKV